jgi:hypothetical protein
LKKTSGYKKDDIIENRRILHNEELHSLSSLPVLQWQTVNMAMNIQIPQRLGI